MGGLTATAMQSVGSAHTHTEDSRLQKVCQQDGIKLSSVSRTTGIGQVPRLVIVMERCFYSRWSYRGTSYSYNEGEKCSSSHSKG